VTPENLSAARDFVDALQADGGTNIAGALDAVLGTAVAEDRLPLVIFLTDGVPSVGEQQPDRIAALAAGRIGRARVFAVGLGHDVNTYLLDRLAREGRGAAEYVPPEANVETSIAGLVGKLSRPALVNLRIAESPVRLRELSPAALPDLFFGEELVVFGRYSGQGSGPVVIEGERNGRRERFAAQAVFPAVAGGNEFIPRLWASRRIGDLTRQIRLEGASEGLLQQVKELGLRYGILTEYTSYLVQEPQLAAGPRRDPFAQGVAPAAAPKAQTGQLAFNRARESGRMLQAATLADAEAVAEEKLESLTGGTREVRRAGGRVFQERDGVWTDLRHGDSLRVLSVAPFSPAYFDVVRALPELAAALPVGDQVLIAGRRASLKVVPDGKTGLSAPELAQFVRAFRGAA
jgi:Ca-activated chloride channel family protein